MLADYSSDGGLSKHDNNLIHRLSQAYQLATIAERMVALVTSSAAPSKKQQILLYFLANKCCKADKLASVFMDFSWVVSLSVTSTPIRDLNSPWKEHQNSTNIKSFISTY
eukprot:Pompholyxophrys_punicea_v1_NODE_1205_length_868_cov_1.517835.p1 type:complete len:110 gc:universal NODE_1205_length_868_cov_1.517835:719-390(-)